MQHHPQWTGHLATLVHLQHCPAANEPQVRPLQFDVTATRADGSTARWTATGGTSIQHTLDAMEVAGLGGVVRVLPLRHLVEVLPC